MGRWRAVRGRLRTEETAERSARQICPSRVSSWESVSEEAELEGEMLSDEESTDDSDSAGLC